MSEAEQAQEAEIIGPGEILKQAREKQGLSIEDMAGKLHLKANAIGRLESDEYDENISLTFTKGYLKLYAKHVGVDEQSVLAAFEKQNTKNKEPAKLQSFSRRVAKQASDDRLMLVTYLIVAVVIALVVVWWFQQSDSETSSTPVSDSINTAQLDEQPVAAPNSTETANIVAEDAPTNAVAEQSLIADTGDQIEPQDMAQEAAPDVVNTLEQQLQQQLAGGSEQQLTDASQQQTEQQQDQAESISDDVQNGELTLASTAPQDSEQSSADAELPIQLVFTFAEDCWMNLTDATGEAIAYGVKKSGRVMTVAGQPPFEVTLGAPAVVQITYDGMPIDMSQFDAGRTARFTLPLQG